MQLPEDAFKVSAQLLDAKTKRGILQARRLAQEGLGDLSKVKEVKAAQLRADEKSVQVTKVEGQLEQAKARAHRAVAEMAELGDKLVQLRRELEEATA